MNLQRTIVAFALALLISGLFTWTVGRTLRSRPSTAPRSLDHIVVVGRDVPAGEVLAAESLSVVEWAAPHALAGSLENPSPAVGRVALVSLVRGEPVLVGELAAPGSGSGVAALIPHGMRAITIRGPEVGTVSSLVQPGDLVDVLATYSPERPGSPSVSAVLQAVPVFAVGERISQSHSDQPLTPGSITLLVEPSRVPTLNSAMNGGRISIVMRNRTDTTRDAYPLNQQTPAKSETNAPRMAVLNLLGVEPHTQKTTSFTVQTIAGGKLTNQSFEGASR